MAERPMITGIYGSYLLDIILKNETQPSIYEGKKQGYEEASSEYEKEIEKLNMKVNKMEIEK